MGLEHIHNLLSIGAINELLGPTDAHLLTLTVYSIIFKYHQVHFTYYKNQLHVDNWAVTMTTKQIEDTSKSPGKQIKFDDSVGHNANPPFKLHFILKEQDQHPWTYSAEAATASSSGRLCLCN